MSEAPKVLVVEDEAIIARDIQMQLTDSGFAVTGTANTATDAFRQIEQTAPDLVLMDIRIKGGMDGVDAAQIVRNRYALPVIYLTAHADETTLERAQLTEPFGYIVKPLGNTNIKAMATMALHKHRMERELENHRKMLSTVLRGMADAMVVTDSSGAILFLNRAAELLTGWNHNEAAGRSVLEVAPLEDNSGRIISSELLHRSIAQDGTIRIPRNTVLLTKNGESIDVSGHLYATAAGNRIAGVFISLQDVTAQKREEQRLSQEQQLFVAGELARGVAQEFYPLYDLIEDCADQLTEGGRAPDIEMVKRASRIGMGLSLQLKDFRESNGTAQAINVSQHLLWSQALLRRFCGSSIEIEFSSEADAGCILSTGSHFEQLLMHLVLDAKQRVSGQGKLAMAADVHDRAVTASRNLSYVRLAVRSERSSDREMVTNSGAPYPFDIERPGLSLSIVRAIVTASGGFTKVSQSSKSDVTVEIFLPRHDSQISTKAPRSNHQRVILAIGLQLRLLESLHGADGENTVLLDAASLNEGSLIADLYPDEIDLVVVNDNAVPPKTTESACDRIRARRPNTAFLHVSSPGDYSGLDAMNPADLARQIENFFNPLKARAVASVS